MKKGMFLLMLLSSSMAMAQSLLTFNTHAPRGGDIIHKQQVPYIETGATGKDIIWDFSKMEILQESVLQEYLCDTNHIITCVEPSALYQYQLKEDSLLQTGYETPIVTMKYSQPILRMEYPFDYGYTAEKKYKGIGLYSNNNAIEEEGTVRLEADAIGSIILSEKDTLRNVLRMHILKTSSVGMAKDSLLNDSIHRHMEIEDICQWYARGYRYPIFETRSTSYYHNLDVQSNLQTAYRYMPEEQYLLNDSVNKKVVHDDSLLTNKRSDQPIIYTVQCNRNTIVVNYNLRKDARITALVTDMMGVVYRRNVQMNVAGEAYSMRIDCSGLKQKEYILYLNVNGQAYSHKVSLKD